MNSIDNLHPSEVGKRLRIAREKMGLRQANVAEHMGLARTTLVAIEKGQRRAKIGEVQKLARHYNTTVNGLLRNEAVHVDLVPRFRRLPNAKHDAREAAIQLLSDLAQAEVELENLLGVERTQNLPPELPITRGDIEPQAERHATELRELLGLGISPIGNIIELLEMELGVRVYVRRIDSNISGLFAYDERLGACMLLNANHPRTRRTYSAGHELGHLVSARRKSAALCTDEISESREERYANAFAGSFLAPRQALETKFKEVTVGSDSLTRRHVIVLAHFFGISREALVRRLEALKLMGPGTWGRFCGSITDKQEHHVLRDLIPPDAYKTDADHPTTLRIGLLANAAYREGLLSEGQLADLLKIDRMDIRQILDNNEAESGEAHEIPKLPG